VDSDDKFVRELARRSSKVNLCLIEGEGNGKRDQFHLVLRCLDLWLEGNLGTLTSADGVGTDAQGNTVSDPLLRAPTQLLKSLQGEELAGGQALMEQWASLFPLNCSQPMCTRIYKTLVDGNFKSMRQVVKLSRYNMSQYRTLGKGCIYAMEQFLSRYALRFGTTMSTLDKRLITAIGAR